MYIYQLREVYVYLMKTLCLNCGTWKLARHHFYCEARSITSDFLQPDANLFPSGDQAMLKTQCLW